MKPLPIIISILLLIFSIARFADGCNKREKKKKALEFRNWVTKIENKSDSVMAYRFFATDTIAWLVDHRNKMDITLDSAIQIYKDRYTQDEKRYKIYLKILYEYKKLTYLYSDWIKSCRINETPDKKEKDYKPLTLSEFQRKQRELKFGMGKYNIELMMID